MSSSLSAPAAPAGRVQAGKSPASREQWPPRTFMDTLPAAERAVLLAAGTPVRFDDGQHVLRQGDAGDYAYVLTSGLVKVIVTAESGAETALVIRSRGDLIGEFALLDERPRNASARAVGPVAAVRIGGATFLGLTAESAAVQQTVTRYVLAKLRAATERAAAERVWDASQRLAQVLCELAEQYAEPGSGEAIRIPLTQGDLGELAGVAVSTAERVLKDFRRRGAVGTRYREIVIKDLGYLERIRFSALTQVNPLTEGVCGPGLS